jgi:transcriptional regulator of acetoin/glycerol metabolism
MEHPRRHIVAAQHLVARARAHFLASDEGAARTEGADVDVRSAILDSWRRCQDWNVSADRVEVRYVGSANLDTPLVEIARPQLDQLADLLSGEPVSVILTDLDGVVLGRFTDDTTLERKLDQVNLAPGFAYAERDVGTNGIGTALQRNSTVAVIGNEHYADGLANLACFGVPIRNPVSHKTIGLLDLTTWHRAATPLLAALAAKTATCIEKTLLAAAGQRELALLRQYHATCRRTDRPVLATNNDVMMMNEAARLTLAPEDQSRLLTQAAETIESGRPRSLRVELTDTVAQLECTPAWSESGLAGCVVAVRFDAPVVDLGTPPRRGPSGIPGLAGSSSTWKRCCAEALRGYRDGGPLLLEGEPGAGKLAIAKAVHRYHAPERFVDVFDARAAATTDSWLRDVRAALSTAGGTVILRRVDLLPADILPKLLAELRPVVARGGSGPRLVATTRTTDPGPGFDELLDLFAVTVTVPPLRHRPDDLRDIIPVLLTRLRPRDPVRCSPQAMNYLLRGRWHGNVTDLQAALSSAVHRCRSGVIESQDLPPECRAVGRRMLTPLESLERDAIVNSLTATNGDKLAAAKELHMSRATIYRKIRRYAIDLG